MDKFFKLSANQTTVRTEIIAGLTTFFAMAYIVLVNPNQVAAEGANGWLVELGADPVAMGKIWNAVYIASILVAVFGTLLMGLYAKMPFAQACGMGLNSFFCTIFVSGAFFCGMNVVDGYQAGLVIIFASGVIFLVLSLTGAREYIARTMPLSLKNAIPAGIGLFIAFIGFQNCGLIQPNQYTIVQLVDIHGAIQNGEFAAQAIPAIVALIGLFVIAILGKLNVKGNVIIGIIASTVLYYVFTQTTPSFGGSTVSQAFSDFSEIGITGIFHKAAWSNAFTSTAVGGVFSAIMLIISFLLVDLFDTLGTIYGTAAQANLLDEKGDPINLGRCMMADSVATTAGAVLGTSTCTTFVESASGVAAGGRTGLSSVVVAICFFLCLFVSPLASVVPSCATAPALIFVGVLMAKNFAKVDMHDIASAVPAFLTFIMMPLTYSISNGIGVGAISYVVITLFTGKFKKRDIIITLIAALFVIKFIFVTM